MATTAMGGHERRFLASARTDAWWVGPALTVAILSGFLVYGTWAAFQNAHYWVGGQAEHGFGGYLSPFYSPQLWNDAESIAESPGAAPLSHAWLGQWPGWLKAVWPPFLPYSPGFLILIFPGLFRFTCYYYRKAYYRSFAASPPGCAVGAVPQRPYQGERGLLVFQNLHRYAMYAAVAFIFILGYDAVMAYFRDGRFGVGVGSLVLTVNVILLSGYTFGCHSFRHLTGGRLDCFSCDRPARLQHAVWKKVSWLNARHMALAWTSLFWVAFSDVYVRLVSMGVIPDPNTWN
jgi:hypothetical protein